MVPADSGVTVMTLHLVTTQPRILGRCQGPDPTRDNTKYIAASVTEYQQLYQLSASLPHVFCVGIILFYVDNFNLNIFEVLEIFLALEIFLVRQPPAEAGVRWRRAHYRATYFTRGSFVKIK